jgi:hypothetical protein
MVHFDTFVKWLFDPSVELPESLKSKLLKAAGGKHEWSAFVQENKRFNATVDGELAVCLNKVFARQGSLSRCAYSSWSGVRSSMF